MHAIDCKVLVRFLTGDHPDQSQRALALFHDHAIWIAKTVLLETEWVLRSLYRFDGPRIAGALKRLLGVPGVHVEDPGAVRDALDWFANGLDFADALHLASRGDAEVFATFDQRFRERASRITSLDIIVPP